MVKFEAILENITRMDANIILSLRMSSSSVAQVDELRRLCDCACDVQLQPTKVQQLLLQTKKDTKPNQPKTK